MVLITLVAFVIVLVIGYVLFVSYYPSFGGDVSKELQIKYASSENHRKGEFVNVKNVPEDLGFWQTLKIARKFFFTKVEEGSPIKKIEIQNIDSLSIAGYNGGTRLIWFGHSTFLMQMAGKNILLDPMFGAVPAPHPLLGREKIQF